MKKLRRPALLLPLPRSAACRKVRRPASRRACSRSGCAIRSTRSTRLLDLLERDGTVFDTDKFMWMQARGAGCSRSSTKPTDAIRPGSTSGGRRRVHEAPTGDSAATGTSPSTGRASPSCSAATSLPTALRPPVSPIRRSDRRRGAREIAVATYRRSRSEDNPKGPFTKQIGANRRSRPWLFR